MTKAVHLLMDESGSMVSMKDQAISGYNDYLKTLEGSGVVLALTKFDTTKYEFVHDMLPIEDAVRLDNENYRPGAGTPLYDAMAHVIKKTEHQARELEKSSGERSDVLIVVMTDGEENSSHEYDMDNLNALIKEHEDAWGWNFVYLGSSPDAWKNEAAYHGTQVSSVQSSGGRGLRAAYSATADSTAEWASKPLGAKLDITDDQKRWVKEQSEDADGSLSSSS